MVRRIQKAEVTGHTGGIQLAKRFRNFTFVDFGCVADLQRLQILTNEPGVFSVRFDKVHLLRTAAAREELAERSPERYDQLVDEVGEERLEKICRLIMLYHLDRGWADHQAYLSDIRESIHLRALGMQNPLDEFHRMAVDAFASLAADAIEAAQQTFETANVLEDEPGLDLSKLARPTSTWTYMIHDNPLADDTMAALSLHGVFS